MKIYISFILIFFVILSSKAQLWKDERHSIGMGIGTSNYMGDLGGGNKKAGHFLAFRDIDIQNTNFSVKFTHKYRIFERLYIENGFLYANINGSDRYTNYSIRNNRNLSFKSNAFGLTANLNFLIKRMQKGITCYSILAKPPLFHKYSINVGVGVGELVYNTKILEGTVWKNAYSEKLKFTETLKFSGEVNYLLSYEFIGGIEISNYYLNTDFIDAYSGDTKYKDSFFTINMTMYYTFPI